LPIRRPVRQVAAVPAEQVFELGNVHHETRPACPTSWLDGGPK
jgi:hypothetical protein